MNQVMYIITRPHIFAEVLWDSSQITASQDEGTVLADVLISTFNPGKKGKIFTVTFEKGSIIYGIAIEEALHDLIRTRCLLGIQFQFTTVMHYVKKYSA